MEGWRPGLQPHLRWRRAPRRKSLYGNLKVHRTADERDDRSPAPLRWMARVTNTSRSTPPLFLPLPLLPNPNTARGRAKKDRLGFRSQTGLRGGPPAFGMQNAPGETWRVLHVGRTADWPTRLQWRRPPRHLPVLERWIWTWPPSPAPSPSPVSRDLYSTE